MQAADEAQVERSRFRPFLETLDASLLATTGRTRLRRAAVRTRMVARTVLESLDALERAFALDSRELDQRRAAAVAALASARSAVTAQTQALEGDARGVDERILALGGRMRGELLRSIASALDVADIARLRDRAKLHVLVDGVTANVAGTFAQSFAATLAAQLDRWAERAGVTAVEIAAPAFGASRAAGAWQGELEPALRATVVLGAIGGPAVAFVHAIAARFAATPTGTYMKRELIADLRATLFPALDADLAAFVDDLRASAARVFARLSEALSGGGVRLETAALDAVERVAAVRATGGEAAARAELAARSGAIAARLTALEALFDEPAADAGALSRADEAAIRLAEHVDRPAFDPEAYERGLRPTRWRVAVLGAIKRGKSSLINAIAGERVLADEGGSEELGFPVHVRYAAERAAFALDGAGGWREIRFDEASLAARSSPILIEIPWRMPRELVLVHAPAFDSGDPYAEEIALAVAQASSETLCLFSRQLSEGELTLYAQVARFHKPMLFAHTIADNEAPAERRRVVELAQRYLAERAIVPLRLFTVSTLEYRDALANGRAPAAWNELGALVATLEAHAEEHMAQLARRAAGHDQVAKLGSTPAPPGKAARPPLRQALDRIFRRR